MFTGTVSYHYHFINGAKFYDCVFNIKLGVDHQYGIVSGLLNNCEFTVDCNNHSIYYWVDSHSERQATSIKHTKFDFTNTHGDLFLLGCENDYSKIEIDDVEVSYSNDEWEKPITIRLLGRSKAIDTKGEIYINGLYLNGSTLDYYVNARYENMKVLNCKNIYSNGMKQEDLYYDNTKN